MTPRPCRYCRRVPVVYPAPMTIIRCEHPACRMQPSIAHGDEPVREWDRRHGG